MTADSATRLKESVKWFILSEELIAPGELVVAAVSGGPDSMALLSVLHGISSEVGFRLAAAYFDHQIRDSGAEDRKIVAALARELSVSLYAGEADVRAEAAASGDSLEEAARKARYRFLVDAADRIKAARIATGHTRDDQVETALMRIVRGTGIRGLAGIPVRRGRVIRPLLSQTREATVDYCESRGITCIHDPTNEETRFFRNRIRLELLPHLRSEYNSGIDGNLTRLATNAAEVVETVRERTQPLIRQNVKHGGPGEWIVNIAPLAALDDISIVIFFGDLFADAIGLDMDFTRAHYESVVQLVRNARGSGKMVNLPGITARKEYENIILTHPKASATTSPRFDYRAPLTVPGETSAAGVIVRTEIVERKTLETGDVAARPRAAYFALDRLKLPLVLRCPAAGDRMRPFGMTGSKKLSDIFVDKKVPGRERARSLVVTDAEDILWLVGVTTSEKSRIEPATERVIRITVEEESSPR